MCPKLCSTFVRNSKLPQLYVNGIFPGRGNAWDWPAGIPALDSER